MMGVTTLSNLPMAERATSWVHESSVYYTPSEQAFDRGGHLRGEIFVVVSKQRPWD